MEQHQNGADSGTISRRAMARLDELGLDATPRNYTVLYHYYAGDAPELVRVLDEIEGAGRPINEDRFADLFDKFFAESDSADMVQNVSARIESSLAQVLDILSSAGNETSRYGDALADLSGQLSGQSTGEQVRKVVGNLIEETRAMESRSKRLETRLNSANDEITQLRVDIESVRREAESDPLTDLANRKYFDLRLREMAIESVDTGAPLSVLLFDIDHFKSFNDKYGHQFGDEVLKLVARSLRACIKGRDLAARFGGDEFAVALPDTWLVGASTVAEQIRQTITNKRLVRKKSGETLGTVSLSIGVALFTPGETIEDFFERADMAMYEAKRGGRNRVVTSNAAPQVEAAIG